MRVERTRSSSSVGRRKSVTGPGGFEQALSQSEDTQAAAPVSGSAPVQSVDAVLALQGVDDATQGRARAAREGRRLIDALDRLKLDLLDGQVDRAHMDRLANLLTTLPRDTGDATLDAILQGVETRARVELAKLRRTSL